MDNLNFQINRFKDLIKYCNDNPDILELDGMGFVKKVMNLMEEIPHIYTEKPAANFSASEAEPEKETTEEPKVVEVEEESEESDVELDMEGVIVDEVDDTPFMGDPDKCPSEEELDNANEFRAKAATAYSEQKFEECVELYTKAIELNPGNALYHAKRGQAYLKLKKPKQCIKDCDKALELNCDSASSYKFRGRAHRLLGNWESAAKDLRQACKLDYDEEADEWLKEVTPNAKKLEQHKLKQERRKTEKELKQREARRKTAAAAHEEAATNNSSSKNEQPQFDTNDFMNFMKFMDPEVSAAFKDIMTNPMNIMKYQNNPKVMKVLNELGSAAAGGGAGFPGGFPGSFPGGGAGFPGFPGGFPGAGGNPPPRAPPKPTDFTDDMD